jgi:hypothetical protein
MATRIRSPRSAAVARIDAAISRPSPLDPDQIERDLAIAADLDARRKLARHRFEHREVTAFRRIHSPKHL